MCAAVVETAGEVTDVLSFYTLPSTVIGNPKHSSLKAAYSFYNVARTVELKDLMQDGERTARLLATFLGRFSTVSRPLPDDLSRWAASLTPRFLLAQR